MPRPQWLPACVTYSPSIPPVCVPLDAPDETVDGLPLAVYLGMSDD